MSDSVLGRMLRPDTVVVIGASHDVRKRGYQVIAALRDSGFAGRVVPVNPRGGELLGHPVARSLGEVAGVVDLALVCTPAPTVPAVLEECARRGVAGAVVLAAGFGEVDAAGAALEAEVRRIAARTGLRVIGPNTSGILNVPHGLNLIGARGVRAGGLGVLVQSGNMALGLMNEASAAAGSAGISICIGAGNEADLGFHEYLLALDADAATRVVLMYVEAFRDGRAFLEAARSRPGRTPVVLLKGGRSDAGRAAARSHTGAVAGEYAVFRAAMRQAGVIEVDRSDELFCVGLMLANQPPVAPGAGVAILADGGGHGTLAADALAARGVALARLGDATRDRLRALLGPAAGLHNPIDVAGATDSAPQHFAEAMRLLMQDPAVGGVVMVGLFGGYAIRFAADLAEAELGAALGLSTAQRDAGKPLVVHSLYAHTGSAPLMELQRGGVPVVASLDLACRCIAASAEWGALRAGRLAARDSGAAGASVTAMPAAAGGGAVGIAVAGESGGELHCEPRVSTMFAAAAAEHRTMLLETEARDLAAAHGVQLVPATFAGSARDVAAAVAAVGGPVALRVVSPFIAHKSDAGGVRLNVDGPQEAVAAFHGIMDSARAWLARHGLPGDVRGVLVSPMLRTGAVELLVGAHRDPQFGPVLTVGAGGTTVELLDDVAVRVLPITACEVAEALAETRVHALLAGHRGRPAADTGAVARLALSLADCLMAHPQLAEIEANPVIATSDSATAVDVRAFLTLPHPAAQPGSPVEEKT